MNSFSNKAPENKTQPAAGQTHSYKQSSPIMQQASKHPENALQQIADDSPQVKQLKSYQSMMNVHAPAVVVQPKGINYEAGEGSLWHVHKDHVKYNGDNSSRINFAGRSKTYIKRQMQAYHNTLGTDTNRQHTYLQCRKWINDNL